MFGGESFGGTSGGLLSLVGLGLLPSFINNAFASAENDKARSWQENMYDKQMAFNAAQSEISRDWQEKMYNQYYSPGATVRQFKEAGINPVLASGISPSSMPSGSSASVGSAGQPVSHFSDSALSAVIAQVYDLLSLKSDLALKNAQKNKLESETLGQDIANKYSEVMNEETISKLRNESSSLSEQIKNIAADTKNKEEQLGLIALEKILKMKDSELKDYEKAFQAWREEYRRLSGSDPTLGVETQIFDSVLSLIGKVTGLMGK